MDATKRLNKLKEMIALDELSFEDLKQFSLVAYRMNVNPLPILRKYLALSNTAIPVHYIETPANLEFADLLKRIKSEANPLLILNAVKNEGMIDIVHIFQKVDGKLFNASWNI